MSTYEQKFRAAVDELLVVGIWKSNAVPPYLHLARKLGMQPKPPHYASFWRVAVGMGIWFGSVWGLLMYLMFWRSQQLPVTMTLMAAVAAGVLFGILMALYYRRARTKYKLTEWEEL